MAGIDIDLGQDWQREGCSLTGTSLCQTDDVAAFHQNWDGFGLNW